MASTHQVDTMKASSGPQVSEQFMPGKTHSVHVTVAGDPKTDQYKGWCRCTVWL